ncbi:zinc finger MYM-type protein 1-like [Pecten maximus]|uniref:zinc finger MYM-type protein 1-like n=1 Tax=Pecten maximus TaxID=6579 RepID=UPI0014581A37|nr:zinc finger MYM-type protein 1-like [Pecten maximus]
MADEATDCSTKEQIALYVRYFNRQQGEVCEEFLGYREASSTTGQALAETFLEALDEYGINIDQMRGQGYDGAANMAGVHRGVQARIRERVPLALYTHCRAHSCKETIVRNMMDTVQTAAFAFDYSAKRLLNFEECLANDDEARMAMNRKTKLKTLCETRWFSRVDALNTFLKCFAVVVESLEELGGDGDSKARGYALSIKQYLMEIES